MTHKFFNIVLADLVNSRDIKELELSEVYGLEISLEDRIGKTKYLLGEISHINNQIKTLTGMVSEEVINNPQTEDNNNN